MIIFQNVSKKYGKNVVLDQVGLKINPGEFVSIIGPSGAGKSTLISLLIGAEKLSGGSISVDGYAVNKMRSRAVQYYRRRIGVVFQDYKLLKHKNVFENVAFALEVCGYDRTTIKEQVNGVLKKVGLENKAKLYPRQLSGGEKQRVAIARALVHNPGLLVADEPTGNLDPLTGKEIIKILLEIHQQGTTVLLTTHNRDLVDFLKKRVIVLQDGKVVSDEEVGKYKLHKI